MNINMMTQQQKLQYWEHLQDLVHSKQVDTPKKRLVLRLIFWLVKHL